jgi:hypothetical protein
LEPNLAQATEVLRMGTEVLRSCTELLCTVCASSPKTFSQKEKSTQINSDCDEIWQGGKDTCQEHNPKFEDQKNNKTPGNSDHVKNTGFSPQNENHPDL